MRVILGIIVLASMVHAQAQPSQTKSPFDVNAPAVEDRDLSGYSSYTWNKSQVAVDSLANHLRLINAIQKEMKKLDYHIDTVKPQALVQYRVDRRTAVSTNSTQKPSNWDPTDMKVQINVNREEQITLVIELVDAESNFLLWQGKGTYPLGTPDKAEREINAAVADLFAKYPRPNKKK